MFRRLEESEVFRRLKDTAGKFSAVAASMHASSIAYYTFLSTVPLLAICISAVSMVGVAREQALGFVSPFLPETFKDLVRSLVDEAYNVGGLAFSVSTLSLIWSASKSAKALRAGLNSAYGERESRSVVGVVAISIVSVVVMGVMIALQMWLVFGDSLLSVVSRIISDAIPHEWFDSTVTMGTSLVFGISMFDVCYTYLPDGRRSLVKQLPGAVFAMAGIHVLSWGFRVYVERFGTHSVLYGSLATVVLFLFWMYLVFYIMIAGAFLNRLMGDREKTDADGEEAGEAMPESAMRTRSHGLT